MICGKFEGGPVLREMSQAEDAVLLAKGLPRPLFEWECPYGMSRRIINSDGQKPEGLAPIVVEYA
jgi:hypothetical protein